MLKICINNVTTTLLMHIFTKKEQLFHFSSASLSCTPLVDASCLVFATMPSFSWQVCLFTIHLKKCLCAGYICHLVLNAKTPSFTEKGGRFSLIWNITEHCVSRGHTVHSNATYQSLGKSTEPPYREEKHMAGELQ